MRNIEYIEKIKNGRLFYISALAGSGKTTLLFDISKYFSQEKILYISFNEKIAKESGSYFPPNVDCRTIHSIAYEFIGNKYKNKINYNIPLNRVVNSLFLNNHKNKFIIAKKVIEKINQFLFSEYNSIDDVFMPNETPAFRKYVKYIYEKMDDPKDSFPITHDFYLKKFQKSIIYQDFLWKYSTILLDEAQDSNGAIKGIIYSQSFYFNKKVIIVGDSNQYIYGFRGSVNIFDSIDDTIFKKIELNKTYRFGKSIADIANKVLKIKNENQFLIPNENIDSKINIIDKEKQYTIINRTNAGVIGNVLKFSKMGKKIFIYGNLNLNYKLIIDLYHLKTNRKKVLNPNFKKYKSFDSLKEYAKSNHDNEMLILIRLVDNYGDEILKIIERVNRCIVFQKEEADVIIGSVHSTKGVEFNQVVLGNDFYSPFDKELKIKQDINIEELNILYTAITRAKFNLKLNSVCNEINKRVKL